ncbi:CrcB family protein [Leucobacter sp. G161]|uniref:fluoride efflux transporter FluC n=1 Tax=Leucobacter sp. G161 TaxID=663704 RepID=UPI00073CB26C|nr:CrcB family protein [Leucobacter sp. G161]KUF06717.1 hypothetical protein AUL38_11885 [Leucobacter sp. G161]
MNWCTVGVIFAVALGGGVGSMARYAVDRWIGSRPFPWGITVVNITGSLLLGLLIGALAAAAGADGLAAAGSVLGSGELGRLSAGQVTGGEAAVAASAGSGAWAYVLWLALGIGCLGGFTTFSTASLDTVRLAQERRVAAATANAFGTLGVSVAAAVAGIAIAGAGVSFATGVS